MPPQFCRAYLPAHYDPAKQWPMMVYLHGYNGQNPPYVGWWSVDMRHHDMAERHDVIVIEPGLIKTRFGDTAVDSIDVPQAYFVLDGTDLRGEGWPQNFTKYSLLVCNPSLSAAAIEAVRKWSYKPATAGGKPVRAKLQITITFKPE